MGGTMPRERRHPAATDGATGLQGYMQPLSSLAGNVRSLRDRLVVENKSERTSSSYAPALYGGQFHLLTAADCIRCQLANESRRVGVGGGGGGGGSGGGGRLGRGEGGRGLKSCTQSRQQNSLMCWGFDL